MPKAYKPELLWNYSPLLRPVPTPGIQSATQAPTVCVEMSAALIPYLLTGLEIYRWKDKFQGTESEVATALGVIQDLIVLLTEGNCESSMPTQFRFTEECLLEYSQDNGVTFLPVPGWSQFAELCFRGPPGPQGEQGPPGAQGAQGPQGLPGECPPDCAPGNGSVDVDPPPPTNDNNVLCGIAEYLTSWHDATWRAWMNSYEEQAAVSGAGAGLAAAIGQLIGAGLTVTYAGLSAAALGIAAIGVGVVQDAVQIAQLEDIQCKLYCILKADGGFNNSTITQWKDAISADSGTNIGVYWWGQSLTVFTQATWNLRAQIGSLDPSGACALLCTDCPDDCVTYDFVAAGSQLGWQIAVVQNTQVGLFALNGFLGHPTNTFDALEIISPVFTACNVREVKFHFNETFTGSNRRIFDMNPATRAEIQQITPPEAKVITLAVNRTVSQMRFNIDRQVNGSTRWGSIRLVKIEICGENCG